jgi:hypothetical protein
MSCFVTTKGWRFALGIGLIVNLITLRSALARPDPDKDPHLAKLAADSDELAQHGKSADAIANCDKIIAAFKAYYKNDRRKIYCGNTPAEKLGNLLESVANKQSWSNDGRATNANRTA